MILVLSSVRIICFVFFHRFLGHLYAAEALILSDKPNEAIDMLKESNALDDIEPEIQEQLTTEQWKPDKQKSAKAVLYYNLAVALTLRGDLDKAGELLKQVCTFYVFSFHNKLYIKLKLLKLLHT